MTPKRRRAAALLVGWHVAAFAGRPLDTDDAAVIPPGSCQIETFARRVGPDGETAANREYGFAPTCNPFGVGEIMVGANRYGVGQPDSLAEAVLQYKNVPMPISRSHPGLGFNLSLTDDHVRDRPQTHERFASVVAIASIAPFPNAQFDGNLGGTRRLGPSADAARDHFVAGVAAEWSLTQRLGLVAERIGTTGVGHSTQGGLTFVLSPRVTFDAALGVRRVPDGRATFVTVGLTWVSKSGVITPE